MVYLRGLRRHMDYATGMVGARRGISRQQLAEVLYLESGQGKRQCGTPTHSLVRHALAVLQGAGLIERRSQARRLMFFLPLATTDQSAQKKCVRAASEQHPTNNDRPEASNGGACGEKCDRPEEDPEMPKCDRPPESGIPVEDLPPPPPPDAGQGGEGDAPIDPVAWARFCKHRAELRVPLTYESGQINKRALATVPLADQGAVVANVVAMGWRRIRGVQDLPKAGGERAAYRKSSAARFHELNMAEYVRTTGRTGPH